MVRSGRPRATVSIAAGQRSAMKLHVIDLQISQESRSPVRVIEQGTGREVGWVNRYLDREYVAAWPTELCACTRTTCWTLSAERDLTESTLPDYIRFQSGLQPRPSGSTINPRIAFVDRSFRIEFPEAPRQMLAGFISRICARRPTGLARPHCAISRLRVKEPKRCIVPLSIDEVARFWSSFGTYPRPRHRRFMLLHGLRSADALNPDDVLLSEGHRNQARQSTRVSAHLRFGHRRAGVSLSALMRLQVTPQDV